MSVWNSWCILIHNNKILHNYDAYIWPVSDFIGVQFTYIWLLMWTDTLLRAEQNILQPPAGLQIFPVPLSAAIIFSCYMSQQCNPWSKHCPFRQKKHSNKWLLWRTGKYSISIRWMLSNLFLHFFSWQSFILGKPLASLFILAWNSCDLIHIFLSFLCLSFNYLLYL